MGDRQNKAADELEVRRVEVSPDVLVIGAGPAGLSAAVTTAKLGFKAIVVESTARIGGRSGQLARSSDLVEGLVKAAAGLDLVEVLTGTTVTSLEGRTGQFSASLTQNDGSTVTREIGAIIVATGLVWPLGKNEGPVRSFASFESMLVAGKIPSSVGFVADPLDDGETVAHHAIDAALTIRRRHSSNSYIFGRHFTVKGSDGHSRYEEALKAGVRFFRTDHRGCTVTASNGGATVAGHDAILDREFSIDCDLVVSSSRPAVGETTRVVAEMFGCRVFGDGYLTPGNVMYHPCSTTRRGVFAAGSCTCEMQIDEAARSGTLAAQEALRLLRSGTIEHTVGTVAIDPKLCVSCLTCLRICPVGAFAIDVDQRAPVFADIDCQDCGSCVSTCPQRAIRHGHMSDDTLVAMAQAALDTPGREGPLILGLCCRRSGIAALQNAQAMELTLPSQFHSINLPCAGIVSSNLLMQLLNIGVDHVMVVACHEDNCNNRHGSHLARERVQAIQKTLEVLGESTSRATFHAISSSSPRILIERIWKIAQR